MRIIFFGTPNIAVPTLEALFAHKDFAVVAAVTQPDKAAGRGQKLHPPPVKVVCENYKIPVFQPEKLSKSPAVFEELEKLAPDLIVMVAFGQILKKNILALPKYGVINLHASLLPRYRGAAPINWAIINGDTVTGITTMFTEAGLDTGPILLAEKIDLDETINAQELSFLVAQQGAQLVIKTIEALRAGKLEAKAQDDKEATYAPILDKALANINWQKSAKEIHNLVRGLIPWPLAFTTFRGNKVTIWRTQMVLDDQDIKNHAPGALRQYDKRLFIRCADTWLEIKELQPANKAKLSAKDWLNGAHIKDSDSFQFIESQVKAT